MEEEGIDRAWSIPVAEALRDESAAEATEQDAVELASAEEVDLGGGGCRISDTSFCISEEVLLYMRTAVVLRCPVRSIMTCSSTFWFIRLVAVVTYKMTVMALIINREEKRAMRATRKSPIRQMQHNTDFTISRECLSVGPCMLKYVHLSASVFPTVIRQVKVSPFRSLLVSVYSISKASIFKPSRL